MWSSGDCPRAIAEVASSHPGLAVVLEEASTPALLRRLRMGRLETAVIGVGHGLPDYDLGGLWQTTLLRGDLLVVVPDTHRFAGRDGVTVPDLAREHWIGGAGAAGEPQFGAWPTLAVIPDLALPALPSGVRTVAVADSHCPGRATVVVTRPHPSAQAQAMVIALQDHAGRLHTS